MPNPQILIIPVRDSCIVPRHQRQRRASGEVVNEHVVYDRRLDAVTVRVNEHPSRGPDVATPVVRPIVHGQVPESGAVPGELHRVVRPAVRDDRSAGIELNRQGTRSVPLSLQRDSGGYDEGFVGAERTPGQHHDASSVEVRGGGVDGRLESRSVVGRGIPDYAEGGGVRESRGEVAAHLQFAARAGNVRDGVDPGLELGHLLQ
mmetsp:Transcript_10634/g.23065  ORF Transcript_10634/g.23065 Transcript_10634/m.23065 type:complete len:204 (-) Transcript_10634:128-739(-)